MPTGAAAATATGSRWNDPVFLLLAALLAVAAAGLFAGALQRRRDGQKIAQLRATANFYQALESSMRTGLRVLDLQGRIVYVNPAFCAMTGWSAEDLIEATPPLPYWPLKHSTEVATRLHQEQDGATSSSGRQVTLRRKNGSLFEARMHAAPLCNAQGRQTGWIASVIDISEPSRVRAQLIAARQRFTAVLEALGASVSVASIGGVELLFANSSYRHWFGDSADGHLRMALKGGPASHPLRGSDDHLDQVDSLAGFPLESLAAEAPDQHTEVYFERLGRRLDVRSRYLHWVDGRLVQIIIATDVTARHAAEERLAAQAKRTEAISRLAAMGEMASSVAHELNQPLAAISNYCTGALARLQRQRISQEELQEALTKAAHQAQRAGQVIRHIRSFVQRSAPRRRPTAPGRIVARTLELIELDLGRRAITFTRTVPTSLPAVCADPVLIEQVLINLIRNSADAVDAAQRATRHIDLTLSRQSEGDSAGVLFAVSDSGTGLAEVVQASLYEPFFSTKSDGMGIGLGLCRSIVESHHGRIAAHNLYNENHKVTGCRFTFWLPAASQNNNPTERMKTTVRTKWTSP